MHFQLLALVFDGQIAEVFNSPFIVPVAGCLMTACITVAGIWSGVRTREIRSHERLAMIAQGLQPEPEPGSQMLKQATGKSPEAAAWTSQPTDGSKARRAGVVLCSVASGLIGFFFFLTIITRTPEVLSGAAAGVIPLAIGLGFLADARMKRRDYERWLDRVFPRLGGYGVGSVPEISPVSATAANVMPPPPVGMTPAQASDWRPLH